jgi:hypothetical protein
MLDVILTGGTNHGAWEDDSGAGWSPIPPRRVGRPLSRGSGSATAVAVGTEQPASTAHARRAAGTALVVAHRGGDPLEDLALGLARRAVVLRARLQERHKGMLVHALGS